VALGQTGQPPARFGFGPPPSSAELAARPQTPGATGDQQRHDYFAAAGTEMPYRLYVPQSYDPAVAAPPPQVRTPDEEARYRALSEADVMNVLGIVRKEYHVDSNRIYLMGHSMRGFGTWWLGQKYADTWAALVHLLSGPATRRTLTERVSTARRTPQGRRRDRLRTRIVRTDVEWVSPRH